MRAKLIILGCGSSVGVPRIDGYWGHCDRNNKKNIRTRCSAIIIKGSNYILIDTSPDIKKQILSNKIKNINSILFTHEHADQTNGLFEIRPFYWNSRKKIEIYANRFTLKSLIERQTYLFKGVNDYPALVNGNVVKKNFSLGKGDEKINFRTTSVKHGKTNSIVYIFEKTAYISDSDDLSIINKKELKNLNYLIIDCLKYKRHPSHFNLQESMFIHYKLKPKKTILTNLHHDIDYNALVKILPKNILPAYDGLKLNL